jgi:anti-anti-sigma factor
VSEVGGDATVMLKGEIDLGRAPLFDPAVTKLADVSRSKIRVDLRDVSFVGPSDLSGECGRPDGWN